MTGLSALVTVGAGAVALVGRGATVATATLCGVGVAPARALPVAGVTMAFPADGVAAPPPAEAAFGLPAEVTIALPDEGVAAPPGEPAFGLTAAGVTMALPASGVGVAPLSPSTCCCRVALVASAATARWRSWSVCDCVVWLWRRSVRLLSE